MGTWIDWIGLLMCKQKSLNENGSRSRKEVGVSEGRRRQKPFRRQEIAAYVWCYNRRSLRPTKASGTLNASNSMTLSNVQKRSWGSNTSRNVLIARREIKHDSQLFASKSAFFQILSFSHDGWSINSILVHCKRLFHCLRSSSNFWPVRLSPP